MNTDPAHQRLINEEVLLNSLEIKTAKRIKDDKKASVSYLIISNNNNRVIQETSDYKEVCRQANLIRSAGGAVTIFRSLES